MLLLAAHDVPAQELTAPEPEFSEVSLDELLLEEIAVTARGREERLQETPISITAFSQVISPSARFARSPTLHR